MNHDALKKRHHVKTASSPSQGNRLQNTYRIVPHKCHHSLIIMGYMYNCTLTF